MEKFYQFLQKTPMPQKLAILFLLIVMMVGGYWWFGYRAQQDDLAKLERDLSKAEEELHKNEEIAANLTEFMKKVEQYTAELEENKKFLPDDTNMDKLLRTLNQLAEDTDVRILQFTPSGETRKEFYAEIPVWMNLEGSFHEIVMFFDKISQEERIINVSSINMQNPQMKNGKMLLEAGCTAKTFRAMAENEKPLPDPKAKKKAGGGGGGAKAH